MEVNNITMTGLGRAMSDLDAKDGELSVCHNIILDNGSMRPMWIPEEKMTLQDNEKLVYVHRTSGYKNYIIKDTEGLKFFTDDDPERKNVSDVPEGDHPLKLSSIGNTLIISMGNGINYSLYKDGSYKFLGTKPPMVNVDFYMIGDNLRTTQEEVSLPEDMSYTESGKTVPFSDANSEALTDKVIAHINKAISDESRKGKFTSSFFVRWGYVFLGQTYMVSPPVLIRLNEGFFPFIHVIAESTRKLRFYLEAYTAKLACSIRNTDTLVEDWKDIITGIEIYISSPITRYDQNGKVEGLSMKADDTVSRSLVDMPIEIDGTDEGIYAIRRFSSGSAYLTGFHKDPETYYNEYVNNSQFYMLKRFNLDELVSSRFVISESLENLETLPRLSNTGYQEFDTYIADGLFVYNGRLNLYGVKEKKHPFRLGNLTQYSNGYVSGGTEVMMDHRWKVRFVMSSGQQVDITSGSYSSFYEEPVYLFYPDNNIDKVIIQRTSEDNVTQWATVTMKSHPYLQGSYWFNNLEGLKWSSEGEDLRATDGVVDESNKIYTSEVNNPFLFPLEGINSVGTGEIIGVSTVTKALSQGQFGQFPLYVFSSDGVWAMEVGSTGLYSSVKPVSRDVCINGESITQTDDSVFFVTEMGIMILNGSNITCVSDMMNGRSFDIASVDGLEEIMNREGVSSGIRGIHDFMEYAREARMAYDYPNGRIFLYREGSDYVYVFSLSSLTWATLGTSIENSVSDYPDTYIQAGTKVMNLSDKIDYDNTDEMNTLLVTRPVKLGDDGYKTVYELVARGAMDRSKGAVFLWGSHDGLKYVLIKAVNGNRIYRTGGSGYRYFRIGVKGNMNVGETLSMVSVGFRRKYTNRLR